MKTDSRQSLEVRRDKDMPSAEAERKKEEQLVRCLEISTKGPMLRLAQHWSAVT
jgi:hypothetical protein